MTIQDIINELAELGTKLESGRLSAEEVVEMADLSRDLYERLVVIRHKAYEDLIREERKSGDGDFIEPINTDSNLVEESPAGTVASEKEIIDEAIAEEPIDREVPVLDEADRPIIPMGSAEVSPNQISLIDSIEEIKQMEQSLNDKFHEMGDEKSLGQKLKQKPIGDLPAAIGINQKFRYISSLFNNDQSAFDKAVQKLNSFGSYIEADEYIQNTLSEQYDWQKKDPVVKEFTVLVERRYL